MRRDHAARGPLRSRASLYVLAIRPRRSQMKAELGPAGRRAGGSAGRRRAADLSLFGSERRALAFHLQVWSGTDG